MALKVKDIIDRANALKADRGNWESWWQHLAKYCLPRKAEVTQKKSSGTEFDRDVYDSTAIESANLFASGIMGYMTNPNEVWSRLRASDDSIQEAEGVAEFFERANDDIHRVFHGSNFYEQLFEFYLDFGIFGTSGFYSEEDPSDLVRYYSRPIRELLFEEDDRGRLKIVYRIFEMTAQQAVERWGEKAGTQIVKAAKSRANDKFEFLQCVGPRTGFDPSKRGRLNKPIQSVWISKTDNAFITEGGFDEQPFHIARSAKASAEKHGYSPAMNALPDIRMANRIAQVLIRASMKVTDPPMMLPHDNYVFPISMNPGAVNYKLQSTGAGSDEKIEFLMSKGDLPAGREMLFDTRETIKRAFFADLFLMLSQRSKQMTAFEVSELIGERMLILGPMLVRLQNELLQPVIVRTFNMLLRLGRLGEIPAALFDAPDYRVEYVSVLARAQQLSQLREIQTFMISAAELSKINAEVIDLVNADETLRKIADLSGISVKLINSDEAIEQRRAQRRQAEEAANRVAMAQAIGQAAKTGGEAANEFSEAGVIGGGR
jgi:hypothetical protein